MAPGLPSCNRSKQKYLTQSQRHRLDVPAQCFTLPGGVHGTIPATFQAQAGAMVPPYQLQRLLVNIAKDIGHERAWSHVSVRGDIEDRFPEYAAVRALGRQFKMGKRQVLQRPDLLAFTGCQHLIVGEVPPPDGDRQQDVHVAGTKPAPERDSPGQARGNAALQSHRHDPAGDAGLAKGPDGAKDARMKVGGAAKLFVDGRFSAIQGHPTFCQPGGLEAFCGLPVYKHPVRVDAGQQAESAGIGYQVINIFPQERLTAGEVDGQGSQVSDLADH